MLACTERLMDVALGMTVPHIKQKLSLPLSNVDVSEDPTDYARDPDKPLRFKRLLLIVKGKRQDIVY